MINSSNIKETRQKIGEWKKQGLIIGFVPTMGFLHIGHKSLIEKARQENDIVVVSIFVNPIQFGPNEDFEKYPRNMEHDLQICIEAGADLVFTPTVEEMYPSKNLVYIDVNELGDGLCGAERPGHFRGVCTVVSKLLSIISPNKAYFGQKDAQQLAIINRMVMDLNIPVEIISCPIIREPDGLAMSSRNTYLSKEERAAALVLSKSLAIAKQMLMQGERNAEMIKQKIINNISKEPLARINYVEIVDYIALKPITKIGSPTLIAVAVYIGKTRLIDNLLFKED